MVTKTINIYNGKENTIDIPWIGDKLYVVENTFGVSKQFAPLCPACKNKRIVPLNIAGETYEVDCPICNAKRSAIESYQNILTLRKYDVNEYIINGVNLSGEPFKGLYKKNQTPALFVKLTGFYRYGRCEDDYKTITVNPFLDIATLNSVRNNGSRVVFRTKEEASTYLESIRTEQKESLKEFNKKMGTDYEYPF